MDDAWASGNAYESYMGRWSALVSREFLGWLAAPAGGRWLDVGCGTGALTRLVLETNRPERITGIDSSADFIAHAQRSISDPRAGFRVGLAQSLDLDTASVDVVVSGLMLHFVPQPEAALLEMVRVVRPGGVIGVFVWDYSGGMQMLRYFWDAVVALDPAAVALDEDVRFPLCREGSLKALARAAGLKGVRATALDVPTVFRDFDDYWQPFLGGAGPAPNYAHNLSPESRRRLEKRLRDELPADEHGAIALTARAWAIKGTP